MAAVKFQKGSEEWMMFMDYWALCQNFWIAENNDAYWQDFIDASNKFVEKYKNVTDGLFPLKIAMAMLDTKEEERKKI